jgi:hypothetical protein
LPELLTLTVLPSPKRKDIHLFALRLYMPMVAIKMPEVPVSGGTSKVYGSPYKVYEQVSGGQ